MQYVLLLWVITFLSLAIYYIWYVSWKIRYRKKLLSDAFEKAKSNIKWPWATMYLNNDNIEEIWLNGKKIRPLEVKKLHLIKFETRSWGDKVYYSNQKTWISHDFGSVTWVEFDVIDSRPYPINNI